MTITTKVLATTSSSLRQVGEIAKFTNTKAKIGDVIEIFNVTYQVLATSVAAQASNNQNSQVKFMDNWMRNHRL